MSKNQKSSFILSLCMIFLMPGYASADDGKVDIKNILSDKAQTVLIPGKKHQAVKQFTIKEYSMRIIRPNPNIDYKIVRNTFDPNVDYKLRIINPYTKKEITGFKGPCFGSFRNKSQQKVKKYKTTFTIPAE